MATQHRTGLYIFSLQRQDSLVLGKNFITLENPSTSGRLMTMGAFFASFMATVAAPAYPLRGYRTTNIPTGGTEHAVADICKMDTALPDPKAIVRSNNPAATLGAAFFNSPVGTVKDTIEAPPHEIDAPTGFNPFVLRPGEAIVIRQDVGAVGHLWNVSILWREVSP